MTENYGKHADDFNGMMAAEPKVAVSIGTSGRETAVEILKGAHGGRVAAERKQDNRRDKRRPDNGRVAAERATNAGPADNESKARTSSEQQPGARMTTE
jgi:hypothetical protein